MIALAVFAGAILLAALQPAALIDLLARIFPGILWRVNTAEPMVALTFDDGPHPVYTPQVLEILARHNIQATFFLVGEHAQAHPELVVQIRQAGHEIGNHTGTMATTLFLPTEAFENDLRQAEATLGTENSDPKFFRPAGGWIRPAQLRRAKSHGYTCVLGSAYAFDPYRLPTGYIRWAIVKNLEPGVIVVLHDSGGNRSNTVGALEGILAAAQTRGLRWTTLSELILRAGK
jgi:peptidoglycan/xylan/chitin deacetylase (PgdA/CDA1 family)